MDYCLLINNNIVMNGGTISVYHKNNNVNLTKKITSKKDSIEMKISNIDIKSQTFYMSIEELGIKTNMEVGENSGLSIIEASKMSDPNILFKLKG